MSEALIVVEYNQYIGMNTLRGARREN